MALHQGKFCSLLIRDYFGEVVEKVSNALHWGPRTLSLIVSSAQLPTPKASAIMNKFGLSGGFGFCCPKNFVF